MAKPTEKRALVADEAGEHRTTPEHKRTKRRKIDRDASASHKNDSPNIVRRAEAPGNAAVQVEEAADKTPPKKERKEKKAALQSKAIVPKATGGEPQESLLSKSVGLSWSLTRAAGGRLSDLDPVFTADQKHLILVSEGTVQVYSISTSSMVRGLYTAEWQAITGLKPSPSNPEHIYTSSHSGTINIWNWASGKKLEAWKLPNNILALDVCAIQNSDSQLDAVFALHEMTDGQYGISITCQDRNGQRKTRSVLQTRTQLSCLKVAAGGTVVFATAGDQLLLGQISRLTYDSLKSAEYIWRQITLPVSVTCFDIREPSQAGGKGAKSRHVDLVLGEQDGSILIYNDVLNALLNSESGNDVGSTLISNRLHWHRNSVKTAKWSKDGNYVISGGMESVLVIWQLDTGRKQFLPHLSSHICALVVSPTGNSYALKLADNSAMVISTSELTPTTSIIGLQLPPAAEVPQRKSGKRRHTAEPAGKGVSEGLPAALHPLRPDHLLVAVPAAPSSSSQQQSTNACFLQTFDVRSGRHISRQALARTNISVLKSGPQGTDLSTPDVKHLKLSSDGQWLATIDEWQQYPDDVVVLHPTSVGGDHKREIFLKFWHWNDSTNEWELVSRFDSPHLLNEVGPTSVLDIAAKAEGDGFATIGSDATVRLWSVRGRYRAGQKMRDRRNQPLHTWVCSQSVVLENLPREQGPTLRTAASLAFSEDGSVLAICWTGYNGSSMVYLVDPQSGSIHYSRNDLYSGEVRATGFLDRYLVILSDRLTVWDTVADTITFSMLIGGDKTSSASPASLALNPQSQTFAISFPVQNKNKKGKTSRRNPLASRVAIFSPRHPYPVFQAHLKVPCLSLLPDTRSGGYLIVDAAAHIWRVDSGENRFKGPVPADAAQSLKTGLDNIFGGLGQLDRTLPAAPSQDIPGDVSGGTGKTLADVFDVGPSFALPSMEVLFNDVVGHFCSKSVTV